MIEEQHFYGDTGGKIANRIPKYYKDALRATLEHLKPTTCLEIGTHCFGSAQIFQDYFNDNPKPENCLITCDIFLWGGTKPEEQKNVEYLQVYPHFHDKYMFEHSTKMLPDWQEKFVDSVKINTRMIKTICKNQIDFAFIDADHRAICLSQDLEICKLLNIKNILLEDVSKYELVHESSQYYHEVIKRSEVYKCYDFDNWSVETNCALLERI